MGKMLGERLKTLRRDYQITQDELADKINTKFNTSINKSMISKWENGKGDPYLEYAKYLAIFFNVSLDYLLGLIDINDTDLVPDSCSTCEDNINKTVLAVVDLMEREDARTQRFIYELVRDYLDCNEFERGRLNTAANLKADRTLADKVKTMKKPEDITGEKTDIKEAK